MALFQLSYRKAARLKTRQSSEGRQTTECPAFQHNPLVVIDVGDSARPQAETPESPQKKTGGTQSLCACAPATRIIHYLYENDKGEL